jgi:hypothetical protein
LAPEEKGTRLVLIDELLPAAAARYAAGWDDCLGTFSLLAPQPSMAVWVLMTS